MAKIILNVELNKGTISKDLAEIQSQIQNITVSKTTVSGVDSLQKSFANLLNTLKSTQSSYASDTFADLGKQVQSCLDSVKSLNAEIGDSSPTREQKEQIRQLSETYQKLAAQFATTRAETAKLNTAQGTSSNAVFQLQKSYSNLLKSITGIKNKYPAATFEQFESQLNYCLSAVKALATEIGSSSRITDVQKDKLNALAMQYQKLSAEVATTAAETKQLDTAVLKSGDGVLSMAKKFIMWQAAATLVMQPINAIKNAIKDFNETLVTTEKRVIEIQRVINESIGDKDVADTLYNLAIKYGQTPDDVREIALNFARAGMSWNDTIKATEAAVVALNVAELDATEASDGMIAIMTQFGLSATDLMDIVDKLNITADNAAVTTEKLLTALQRTGSSAKNANLTLDDTLGIITALSEATGRSGENLGTAVNSLIQFSTKSTALDKFAQLSDNMASIVKNYQMGQSTVLDIWKGLSTEIGDRQKSQSILGSLFEDDDWSQLNEQLQAELGDTFAEVTEIYDTASTFRKNYFIALLNNMDKVQEAMDTMQDSAGYSADENEKYLNTYEAKTNALTSKWQKFLNSEQGWLGLKKIFVDIASALLDVWDALGGIWAILPTLFAAIIAFKGQAILASLIKLGKTLVSFVTGIIPSAIAGWKALAAQQISLSAAMQASLPVFAILSLAITGIITLVNKQKQAQEEAAAQALETWKASADTAAKFAKLYDTYKNLEKGTEEYLSTEKELVALLSDDHKNALKDLTAGTDEYREALLRLSEQEKVLYEQELERAKQAAKDKLANANITGSWTGVWQGRYQVYRDIGGYSLFGKPDPILAKYGITLDGTKLSEKKTAEAQLQNYQEISKTADLLWNAYEKAKEQGNSEDAEALLAKWRKLQEYLDRGKEAYEDYVNTQKKLDDLAKDVTEEDKKQEDITDHIKKNISEIGKTLREKVVSALKEARDATKDTYEFEEKKKAVLEAEKELLEAKQERNVRVYNSETGAFEWQANLKSIEQAQEKLDSAKKAVEDAAWDEVIENIESGNATNASILEILNKWNEAYGSSSLRDVAGSILDIIEKATGISIRNTVDLEKGHVTGIGDTRNPPKRPPRISSASSRALSAYVGDDASRQRMRSAGIRSGAIRSTPIGSGRIVPTNATNNYDQSRTYAVGSVSLDRETAETMSFADVMEMVAEQE